MDTNATIVEQIKHRIKKAKESETLGKLRKGPYVDGFNAAMTEMDETITLIENLVIGSGQ